MINDNFLLNITIIDKIKTLTIEIFRSQKKPQPQADDLYEDTAAPGKFRG